MSKNFCDVRMGDTVYSIEPTSIGTRKHTVLSITRNEVILSGKDGNNISLHINLKEIHRDWLKYYDPFVGEYAYLYTEVNEFSSTSRQYIFCAD